MCIIHTCCHWYSYAILVNNKQNNRGVMYSWIYVSQASQCIHNIPNITMYSGCITVYLCDSVTCSLGDQQYTGISYIIWLRYSRVYCIDERKMNTSHKVYLCKQVHSVISVQEWFDKLCIKNRFPITKPLIIVGLFAKAYAIWGLELSTRGRKRFPLCQHYVQMFITALWQQ